MERGPGRIDPASPLFAVPERQAPTNVAAEQALLGAIIANPKAYLRVADFLLPRHFADPVNNAVFAAAAKRIDNGGVADAVTLKGDFENSGQLDEVGGIAYLAKLVSAMVGVINAAEYGRAIFECWRRRELIDLGGELVNLSYDGGQDAVTIGREAAEAIDAVCAGGELVAPPVMLTDAMDAALAAADEAARRGGPSGLSTGMASVDRIIGGLDPGTLTVLGGRPGTGKSALGWQWCLSIAEQEMLAQREATAAGEHRDKRGIVVFSLEMSAMQLGRRALSVISGVPIRAMLRGEHGDGMERLIAARRRLLDLPLVIEEAGGLSAAEILLKCRRVRRRHGIGFIMVDHLQIVQPDKSDNRNGSTAAITGIAHAMKALAKGLGVPVLLLSQLSRALEGREDHRPTKADLRQSGAIEEDADCVAFVYRPEMHMRKSAPERNEGESERNYDERVSAYHDKMYAVRGKAELIFDKVRDGENEVLAMRFDGPTARFTESDEHG